MIDGSSNRRGAERMCAQDHKDFYFAFAVALLAVLVNTYAIAADVSRAVEFTLVSRPVLPLFLLIELCLLINVIGLWTRRRTGFLAAIIALLSVGAGYAMWYVDSRRILELLSSKPFYQLQTDAVPPHLLGLVGATRLNLVVLVLSGALLVWETTKLRGRFCCKH